MNDLATTDPPHAATPSEVLQGALIDSRQRWRELVNLAADFTFETDEWGRFALITPDPALGWATATLIGQPASMLLAEGADAMFDPFRVSARIHHRQAWLKRGDGGVACLTFRAAPIQDPTGRIAGVRGVGIDMTECDKQAAGVAVALRRAEVLDHILWCMGQEILIPRMMGAVLNAIANAMGAEGAAVILAPTDQAAALLAHVSGTGAEQVLDAAGGTLRLSGPHPEQTTATDGRPVLVAGCQTRFGQKAGRPRLGRRRQPAHRLGRQHHPHGTGT